MGIGTAKSIFHQAIIFWFFELKFASEWCGCKTSNWDERKNSEQKLEAFFGREWLRKKRVTEDTSRLLYLSIYGLHPCVLAMNTFLVLGSSALFAAAFPITFSSYTLLFSRLLMITVWRLLERHTKERAKKLPWNYCVCLRYFKHSDEEWVDNNCDCVHLHEWYQTKSPNETKPVGSSHTYIYICYNQRRQRQFTHVSFAMCLR